MHGQDASASDPVEILARAASRISTEAHASPLKRPTKVKVAYIERREVGNQSAQPRLFDLTPDNHPRSPVPAFQTAREVSRGLEMGASNGKWLASLEASWEGTRQTAKEVHQAWRGNVHASRLQAIPMRQSFDAYEMRMKSELTLLVFMCLERYLLTQVLLPP